MPIDKMYISESDTSGFSCSSALLSGAPGKSHAFKDKGSIPAMPSIKKHLRNQVPFSAEILYTTTSNSHFHLQTGYGAAL
jgi:hypothetical protein